MVRVEDAGDVARASLERRVEIAAEFGVALANADRNGELERRRNTSSTTYPFRLVTGSVQVISSSGALIGGLLGR